MAVPRALLLAAELCELQPDYSVRAWHRARPAIDDGLISIRRVLRDDIARLSRPYFWTSQL